MNMIVIRTAAFVVGSMIAGCVYSANSGSTSADAAPMPVGTYPASHRTVGDPNGDSADVTIGTTAALLHLRAVRYDAPADAAHVIAFYRRELTHLGRVSEAKGGPTNTIAGFSWVSGPHTTRLAAGHTVVAVKPVGRAAQYAILDFSPNVPAQH